MNIAAIYTCFNRKEKTLESLRSLFQSIDNYNSLFRENVNVFVYLTDDGCTDGTADAVKREFSDKDIHILQGDGHLYWAGGMRLAWSKAFERHSEWSYYLLLNDDTVINQNCIHELLESERYCQSMYGLFGIISGITCSSNDENVITYGGDIIANKFTGRQIRLGKSSVPQLVDITNANILLVPSPVVEKIGIFYEGYIHSGADNDYSMAARKKGIPVLITSNVCGKCDNDHHDLDTDSSRIMKMTLKERRAYYYHPLHSIKDYLVFIRRNMPIRYPFSWLFCMIRLFFPKLYFTINEIR